jgi:hypothetical protein
MHIHTYTHQHTHTHTHTPQADLANRAQVQFLVEIQVFECDAGIDVERTTVLLEHATSDRTPLQVVLLVHREQGREHVGHHHKAQRVRGLAETMQPQKTTE